MRDVSTGRIFVCLSCLTLLLTVHPVPMLVVRAEHILILGGGLSGLAAARELAKSSAHKVTLLEAKDRLGGRVHTVQATSGNRTTTAPVTPIELGGMYWHGTSRVLEELQIPVTETGGTSAHPGKGGAVWIWNQTELSSEQVQSSYQMLANWNATLQKKYQESSKKILGREDTAAQWKAWHNEFLVKNKLLSGVDRDLLEFHLYMNFDLDQGISMDQHDLSGLPNAWGWKEYGGDDTISTNGMKSVVDDLYREIRQHRVDVHLHERVVKVERSETSCQVWTEGNPRVWKADACIVALPLGVLKHKRKTLFDPPLDTEKIDALQRAGLGTLNTIAVEWNRPICSAQVSAYYLAGQQTSRPFKMFVCSGTLGRSSSSSSFNPFITQFYTSDTVGIPFSNHTYWKEQSLWAVRQVFPHSRAEMTDIIDIHVSAWHLDRDILGSYSAPVSGTFGNQDRVILGSSEGVLFFCGEHTESSGRYQSMDGAFESGRRAAHEAIRYLDHAATCVL